MMGVRANSGGYTLLEVLVAFAVLGMTLAVLFRIFSAGSNNVGTASEYLQATTIGEAQLESSGLNEPLETGRTEGIEAGKFLWTRTVAHAVIPELGPPEAATIAAYAIKVDVKWPAGRDMRHIELETLRIADPQDTTGALR